MNDIFSILIKDKSVWRQFKNPLDIFVVHDRKDLQAVLKEIDKLLNNGKYIAGFFSYEASSGVDEALITKSNDDFPYAVIGVFADCKTLKNLPDTAKSYQLGDWQLSQTALEYNSKIKRIKEYISKGVTYQVNYTMRLNSTFEGNPLSFFANLVNVQQSYYAAYVQFENYYICSASPELFFELNGDKIISRPMKGTAARGLSYLEDISQRDKLKSSEKERAENLMIVDMVRNDLGKICKPNSIKVDNLFKTELYPTVWQMTSEVGGKTKESFSSIINALFPCASITGAPKAETMKIINDLEDTPRKIYTGSIGYFGPNRQASFNVAIRTALIDISKNKVEYGVGSGIVWDSVGENEYEECRVKAKVLTKQKVDFNLLETMYISKEGGIFLLEYHLRRMKQSAEYFNYPFDGEKIRNRLDKLLKNKNSDKKIRLLLNESGCVKIEEVACPPIDKTIKKISIADKHVNSSDVFLYHKTTHRDVYKNAYAQITRDNVDDVILYNEKGQLTESTICNIVLKKNDNFYTPQIECGLLNGTFRQSLIDQKFITEKNIFKKNIYDFDRIYLINSVQQWVQAKLTK